MADWKGKNVVVLGAARQGIALARYLAAHGARVTLTDLRDPDDLQAAIDGLSDLPIEWILGAHPLSLLSDADLVCPSGGVPLDIPFLVEARQRGIPFSNDTQIFLEYVPCKVIGITGSAGKTTTTTLVGRIAEAACQQPESAVHGQQVWVGGNIGNPLVLDLERISADDLVVLELSSFQLELVTRSPQVAALLNLTPNHLDRHGSMAEYTAAKVRILDFQSAADVAVLGRDDPGAWAQRTAVRGELYSFGQSPLPAGSRGTFLADHWIMLQHPAGQQEIMPTADILLRGAHNLSNVLAACAIAAAAQLPFQAIHAGIAGFRGVPHRLELVRTWRKTRWYNDSIATAPERTMAAIRSFDEPLILLAGGRDKKLPWEQFGQIVSERVDHLILFGEAAELIQKAVNPNRERPYTLDVCPDLQSAVIRAAELAEAGDVILLSPGGTSFDEFRDFEERGERFREWVNTLL
ncbi:MAG: UDP-N-acetylmuramoyl-L-alanine--D-glutamate ligase [Anaerolineales bacterium]